MPKLSPVTKGNIRLTVKEADEDTVRHQIDPDVIESFGQRYVPRDAYAGAEADNRTIAVHKHCVRHSRLGHRREFVGLWRRTGLGR